MPENRDTGICDEDGTPLREHDHVTFMGQECTVAFEYGAFGLAADGDGFDRKAMWRAFRDTGLDPDSVDSSLITQCDNFIPFWNVIWALGDVDPDISAVPYLKLAGH